MGFENLPDLYELEDDNGNKIEFELLDEMIIDGITYFAMINSDKINDDGKIVILKREDESNELGPMITIDDSNELEHVGKIFLERIQKKYGDDEYDGVGCNYDAEEESEDHIDKKIDESQ